MDSRQAKAYPSYPSFYRATYGRAIVEERRASVPDVAMLRTEKDGGDWSDAATPDLILAKSAGRASPGTLDLGAGQFRLRGLQSETVVLPPHSATAITIERPHNVVMLAVSYARLQTVAEGVALPRDGDFGRVHGEGVEDPLLSALIDRMWMETNPERPHGLLFQQAMMLALATTLAALQSPDPPGARTPTGQLAPWQLRRVREILQQNLDRDLGLASLAQAVDLSTFHFARAFKASTGVPPHRYLTLLRVERAKELLHQTDLSVAEIAARVGYDAPQGLTRMFRQAMGMTPHAYRRTARF